ncbi:MAG: hypothetical protein AAFU85_00005 [Planctomycetota bacterium]
MSETDQSAEAAPKKKTPLRWLRGLIYFVGITGLFAFVAAFMPSSWIVWITDRLGVEPFPQTPVAFYLARHLSLMYGLIGVALIYVAWDLPRFRDLIGLIAFGVIALGIMQALIDLQSELPLWWTAVESISTILGGFLLYSSSQRRCSQ